MEAPSPPVAAPRQRWFLLGVCLFLLALNIQYVIKIADPVRAYRSAFMRWAAQIVRLGQGENIWERFQYPNTPIMALILSPLVQLPPLAGALMWFYLKVGMAVLSLHWVINLLDRPERRFPWWGKWLTVLLCLRPIEGDLVHGNVNLFILFLVVAALVSYCRRRDTLAGLILALAIACKLTPALFVPYFVWKRAWKTLAGTAIGLVLYLWVIPGLLLGWGENQQYLTSWYRNMVQPFVEGQITSEHVNQSLPGLLTRMLTHSPSFITYVDDMLTPTEYHNVFDLNPAVVPWIIKGCMALFALLVAWRCHTPTADRRSWRLWAEFSIVAVGMLLFSERTWKHHCVVLLLPFAVLAYGASALGWPARRRSYVLATLAGAFVLMGLTSTGVIDRQGRFGELAQVYGAYVWACLLLLGALLAVVGTEPAAVTAERLDASPAAEPNTPATERAA